MTDPSQPVKQMQCFACREAITSEQFVLVGENNYHLEHFVCHECKKALAGQLYYEHDENIYCEEDYHDKFSPKCDKCQLPIKDKYLNVIGKNFHQACFICFKCNSAFENGQYFKQDENPVCIKCYSSQAKKCTACGEPILSKVYSALDKYWHFECFKCDKCGENFKNESFINIEGKPYHQKCHQILCIVCEKPVSGEYYQVEGSKALHKDCVTAYKEKKKKEVAQVKAETKIEEPPKQEEKPAQIEIPQILEPVQEEANKEEAPKEEPIKEESIKKEPIQEEFSQKEEEKIDVTLKIEEPKAKIEEANAKIEESQVKIEEPIAEIKEPKAVIVPPKIEVSTNFEESDVKIEESVKDKFEEKPKPLNKPLMLDESKPAKTLLGSTLGFPAQKNDKKRGSVLVNASNYEVFVPEFEEKKVETLQEGFKSLNVEGSIHVYPYEILTKLPYPAGVDTTKREEYLGEGDFFKVFRMKKEDFLKLPIWKKNELKKKNKLF